MKHRAPPGSAHSLLTRFLRAGRAALPRLSPDGRTLAFVWNVGGHPQLWAVEVDLAAERFGSPKRLTSTAARTNDAHWLPDGSGLVVDLDADGSERSQLWLVGADGSCARDLTGRPDRIHHCGDVSSDGAFLVIHHNRTDERHFDVARLDLATGEIHPLLERETWLSVGHLNPDGTKLLATEQRSSFDSDQWIVDLATGASRNPTRQDDVTARHAGARWLDDRHVLLATDRDDDFLQLGQLDVATGALAIHDVETHDLDDFAIVPGGRRVVTARNVEGHSRLALLDLESGRKKTLLPPGRGIAGNLEVGRDGRWLLTTLEHGDRLPEVHAFDLERPGIEPVRLTDGGQDDLAEAALPNPELHHFESFDGLRVPTWIVPPAPASPRCERDEPPPAIVRIHGGPEAQARPTWDPFTACLTHQGLAVVVPNVRGSTGYGRHYASLDDRERRADAIRDVGALVRWLVQRRLVDPSRLAVMGGSYGGFMTLASLEWFPEAFACGVAIVGVSDFRTFLANTGPWRRRHRMIEYGDPETHGAFLDSISPLRNADRIRAPLLVIQGANDSRVPASEAEQIVSTVRQNGLDVEYLLYPDEGHGLHKLENQLDAYSRILTFLEKVLGPSR